ncbi:hypothetical protein N7495_002265 [Penicillium taxi]|uniref:uncharacterized protein n=1 Tax=Penicillium taxi TaxID=168475 RepID=UPI0025453595|nr:uncharacterized protein N7495_002265 [Penicillium taxi]KAJ5901737.1 hypothetical protein N7495_002265 [Penicillium taxi]
MADPFGAAAGAVGIAAALASCLQCFEYVQFGRHYGRDLRTDSLRLDYAKIRLTRWGDAVNISDDAILAKFNEDSKQLVKNTLDQIQVLFTDTQKISKQNGDRNTERGIINSVDAGSSAIIVEKNGTRTLEHQKKANIWRKTSWALYRRQELNDLIEGIDSLIENLEALVSPSQLKRMVKEELAQVRDEQEFLLIQNVSRDVDPLLHAVATEKLQSLQGHQYGNIKIGDKSKVENGNYVGSDWNGDLLRGASHRYDGIVIGRESKVRNGDRFGKDFMDD